MSSAYADNATYKDYSYDLTGQDFIKQIEPSALTGVTVDGKVTGYPFLVQSHSFIYNKKVFADAGITTLPRTIKEYAAACEKLQAKGIQPFATGFKEWWVFPQTAWQVLASIKDSYGGDYAKFVAALDSGALKFKGIKQMSDVFDMLDLIKKYGGPKPLESDFNDQCASFAAGKVAMIHQGNWAEDSIKKIEPGYRHRLPPRAHRELGGQGRDHVRLEPDHQDSEGRQEPGRRRRMAQVAHHLRLRQ